MLLRSIYLYLYSDDYPQVLISEFGFRTRYLCNFVQRRIRGLKFESDGFNMIGVQGRLRPLDACSVVSEKCLLSTVAFDQPQFQSLQAEERHEFFIAMLTSGVQKCASQHSIPLLEITSAINEFRAAGYRNEWTFEDKLLRPVGIRAALMCRLTTEKFVLSLRLSAKGMTLWEEQILETLPDEIIFAHKFKSVALKDDAIVVLDKFGNETYSVDLARLPRQ